MRTLRLAFLSSLVLEFLATISVALVAVGIGLRLVAGIKSDLSNELRRGGHAGLDELVGADAAAMTAEKWPA